MERSQGRSFLRIRDIKRSEFDENRIITKPLSAAPISVVEEADTDEEAHVGMLNNVISCGGGKF